MSVVRGGLFDVLTRTHTNAGRLDGVRVDMGGNIRDVGTSIREGARPRTTRQVRNAQVEVKVYAS